jgi:S1-C subfamily serine protease
MKILGLLIPFFSIIANAQECTISKVTAKSPDGLKSYIGNSFAISSNRLITNEHTLPTDAKVAMIETGTGQSLVVKVIHRDFHTDMALLEATENTLIPCQLSSTSELHRLQNVEVEGYDTHNSTPSRMRAEVINKDSKKIQVPGIYSALELNGASGQDLPVRKSMSGSIVRSGEKVFGMITQITAEGSSLAIPAEDIQRYVNLINTGKFPKRNYHFDRSTNSFNFDGLELKGLDQIRRHLIPKKGVNPHDGIGVNPHEGLGTNPQVGFKGNNVFSPNDQNQSVALSDLKLGYAVAKIKSIEKLLEKQPLIAEVVQKTNAKTIFIKSIDGKEIEDLFDFIRALGECQKCVIDNFYVEAQNSAQLSNTFMEGIVHVSQFLDSISETKSPAFISTVLPEIDYLNKSMNALARDTANMGGVSKKMFQQTVATWERIEEKLSSAFMTDQELDLLEEIRGLIYTTPKIISN